MVQTVHFMNISLQFKKKEEKRTDPLLEPPLGVLPCWQLDLNPVQLMFRPPGLWCCVPTAIGSIMVQLPWLCMQKKIKIFLLHKEISAHHHVFGLNQCGFTSLPSVYFSTSPTLLCTLFVWYKSFACQQLPEESPFLWPFLPLSVKTRLFLYLTSWSKANWLDMT